LKIGHWQFQNFPNLRGVVRRGLAGGAGALYLSTSCFWSVTADIAGHSAGSVSGVMNMGNQIGGTVTVQSGPVGGTRILFAARLTQTRDWFKQRA